MAFPLDSGMTGYGFGNRMGPMSQYRGFRNPRTDGTMNVADTINAGGSVGTWGNNSGVGPSTEGYRGSGIIGSAAGALGGGGMPTSQRGRLEKFGAGAAGLPSWAAAELMRKYGGLSQSQRYASMGGLPPPAVQGNGAGVPAAGSQAMPVPTTVSPTGAITPALPTASTLVQPSDTMWPKPFNPLNAFAHGTYRPVPHGQPFIAGDPQKDGKPNPEIILPTQDGMEVLPIKDMPMHAEGTIPKMGKPPPVPLPTPKRPTHGMDDFYRLNPSAPPAAVKETMKLMQHPELPTAASGLPTLPRKAYGTFPANGSPMAMPMMGNGLYDVSDAARRRRIA